jgi:vacuolar protein-sorting-associated protein 4
MTDIVSLRNEAKEAAMKAIECDEQNNYPEACKYYIKAAEKLKLVMNRDENQYNKDVYKKKAMEYCERAAYLKGLSTNEEEKKQPITENANGGKNTKDKEKDKEDPDGKLKETLASCVVTEKPDVKWTDVAGLINAKSALQEAVILPMKFPQLFTGKRKPWKGILLYGPPGTGKSYLAKACATEAKGMFFSVSASNIVSKWMGESERLVKALFDIARKNRPGVIFIDEIDSLMSNRSEGENEATRRIKTEFLVQMQGVGKDDEGILVLGATNIPWELDPAVRRRFQKKIYIGLPDKEARLVMLKLNLGNTSNCLSDEDYEYLAEKTEGY